MRGSIEQPSFLRRKVLPKLVGVHQLIALFRTHVAHAPDGSIDGLPAIRWKLPESLKQLARPLLLIGREMLPGFHAVQHALLLLGRQAGKMLQALLQALLLLRRKAAKLGVAFERAALLAGRHVFVVSQPVSRVSRLILRRARFVRTARIAPAFFLKAMPLPICMLSRP